MKPKIYILLLVGLFLIFTKTSPILTLCVHPEEKEIHVEKVHFMADKVSIKEQEFHLDFPYPCLEEGKVLSLVILLSIFPIKADYKKISSFEKIPSFYLLHSEPPLTGTVRLPI
ncbi:MAG: hypothetical protein DSY42_07020 [Aquifex sp.]|nr:MAG: hypothetical protein DSY42_07020 [Aquifex sp.]